MTSRDERDFAAGARIPKYLRVLRLPSVAQDERGPGRDEADQTHQQLCGMSTRAVSPWRSGFSSRYESSPSSRSARGALEIGPRKRY